jgi:hypothetical protein
MDLVQLVYSSRPFGFDDAMLNGILTDARHHNTRDGITGALVCRQDVYLQLLEGDRDRVEATYGRIAKDSRHLEVNRCFLASAARRLFPRWAMRDDPARSWLWSPQQVADGAIARATPAELLTVFARVAAEPA